VILTATVPPPLARTATVRRSLTVRTTVSATRLVEAIHKSVSVLEATPVTVIVLVLLVTRVVVTVAGLELVSTVNVTELFGNSSFRTTAENRKMLSILQDIGDNRQGYRTSPILRRTNIPHEITYGACPKTI
jgi:hypothetical protein